MTAQDECFLRSLGEFPGAAGDVTDDVPGAELVGLGLLRDSPVTFPVERKREEYLLTNFCFLTRGFCLGYTCTLAKGKAQLVESLSIQVLAIRRVPGSEDQCVSAECFAFSS